MTWFLITILVFSIVGFSSYYFKFEGADNDVLASAPLFGIITFILSGMTLSMVVLFAPGYNILRTFRPTDDVGNLTDGMICFEVPDYLRTYDPKKIEKRIMSIIIERAGYKSWQQTPLWRSVGQDGVKVSSLIGFNAYLWFDKWKGGILIAPRSGLLTRFDLATEIKEDVLIDLRSTYGILEDMYSSAYDKLKKAYGQVAASTLERVTAKGTVKTFIQKRGKWVLFTVVTAIIVTAIIIMPDSSVSFFVNTGLGIIAEVLITLYLWYLDRGKGKKKEEPQSQGIN